MMHRARDHRLRTTRATLALALLAMGGLLATFPLQAAVSTLP